MVNVFFMLTNLVFFFDDAAKLKNFSFSASCRIGTIKRSLHSKSNMDAKHVKKESLVESVRRVPCLYDVGRQDYKDDGIWENAWKMVLCEVLEMNPNKSDTVLRESKDKIDK